MEWQDFQPVLDDEWGFPIDNTSQAQDQDKGTTKIQQKQQFTSSIPVSNSLSLQKTIETTASNKKQIGGISTYNSKSVFTVKKPI